jgi:ribonucleotide reductase beta subunit family protein with ferritin-like domain
MGIKEGEKVKAKGICNIFNKLIAENSPNLKKEMPVWVHETFRTPKIELSMAYYS